MTTDNSNALVDSFLSDEDTDTPEEENISTPTHSRFETAQVEIVEEVQERRKKRQHRTKAEKIEIVKFSNSHTNEETSRQFNVHATQVSAYRKEFSNVVVRKQKAKTTVTADRLTNAERRAIVIHSNTHSTTETAIKFGITVNRVNKYRTKHSDIAVHKNTSNVQFKPDMSNIGTMSLMELIDLRDQLTRDIETVQGILGKY